LSSNFKLPTEDEVRSAYDIPAGHHLRIEKVESLPDPDWVKKTGGFLRKVADYFGVPTFLLTVSGLVVAVFFLPYWGPKVKAEVKQAIVLSVDYWAGPFQNLPYQKPEEPATRFAIVTPMQNTVAQNIAMANTGSFSAGTAFYPISGFNA